MIYVIVLQLLSLVACGFALLLEGRRANAHLQRDRLLDLGSFLRCHQMTYAMLGVQIVYWVVDDKRLRKGWHCWHLDVHAIVLGIRKTLLNWIFPRYCDMLLLLASRTDGYCFLSDAGFGFGTMVEVKSAVSVWRLGMCDSLFYHCKFASCGNFALRLPFLFLFFFVQLTLLLSSEDCALICYQGRCTGLLGRVQLSLDERLISFESFLRCHKLLLLLMKVWTVLVKAVVRRVPATLNEWHGPLQLRVLV